MAGWDKNGWMDVMDRMGWDVWMDGMAGWMDGWMNGMGWGGWMDGWMDGWLAGWMDGMDGCMGRGRRYH